MTGQPIDESTVVFERHRAYLFGVAYRLLGTSQDAEDVLQEAWIRFRGVMLEDVETPRPYLVTIVTRLSLDILRSARVVRETYVGPWLPDPVPTGRLGEGDPADSLALRQTSLIAFLWLLERLNPIERAALVLHEAFDFDHEEIGRIIGRTAVASRQALHRARARLEAARGQERLRPLRAIDGRGQRLALRFLEAAEEGHMRPLLEQLAEDVVLVSDAGGRRAIAAGRPIYGRDRVRRGLLGVARKEPPVRLARAEYNGAPALVGYDGAKPAVILLFGLDEIGAITEIFVYRNPDRLAAIVTPRDGSRVDALSG